MSLEEIVDGLTIVISEPAKGRESEITFPVKLYLRFWSGEVVGTRTVTLEYTTPSGKTVTLREDPRSFEGEERGPAADMTVIWSATEEGKAIEEGVHWYTVKVDGQMVTCVPFRVRFEVDRDPPARIVETSHAANGVVIVGPTRKQKRGDSKIQEGN